MVEVFRIAWYLESESGKTSEKQLVDRLLQLFEKDDFLSRFNTTVPEVKKLKGPPLIRGAGKQ